MANWDKLNEELDSALNLMTQEDWLKWKNKNKMGIYRKKPVEIEAIQWVSDNIEQVYEMLGDTLIINTDEDEVKHFINTLEGKMELSWGDYIIRGVKGEFYPCKPDIFELTYEMVEKTNENGKI
jgi:hypothetical protein